MNDKKLGRGLSALLGDVRKIENNNTNQGALKNQDGVQLVSVDKIVAGIYQPRKNFDQHQLNELSNSIKENGIIQPIVLRKTEVRDTFEIIAGERRFRAAKIAGISQVPAIIKEINNTQALEFAIIENVQREDLSPIEEAIGYKQLITEFEYTQDQVSKKIGCSRSHIANILRLLSLPSEVQTLLDEGKISMGHAKVIMNHDDIINIARKIVENDWSVRDVEIMFRNENVSEIKSLAKKERSLKSSKAKNNKILPVKNIEEKLKKLFPENLVKAEFNSQKQRGKITIFFNNLKEIEELIESL